MDSDNVILSVPASAEYARSVRMLAASLAVTDDFSVDDVEDVRMAAEEGFVYACSTMPPAGSVEISFGIEPGEVTMDFVLREYGEGAQILGDLGIAASAQPPAPSASRITSSFSARSTEQVE